MHSISPDRHVAGKLLRIDPRPSMRYSFAMTPDSRRETVAPAPGTVNTGLAPSLTSETTSAPGRTA